MWVYFDDSLGRQGWLIPILFPNITKTLIILSCIWEIFILIPITLSGIEGTIWSRVEQTSLLVGIKEEWRCQHDRTWRSASMFKWHWSIIECQKWVKPTCLSRSGSEQFTLWLPSYIPIRVTTADVDPYGDLAELLCQVAFGLQTYSFHLPGKGIVAATRFTTNFLALNTKGCRHQDLKVQPLAYDALQD